MIRSVTPLPPLLTEVVCEDDYWSTDDASHEVNKSQTEDWFLKEFLLHPNSNIEDKAI